MQAVGPAASEHQAAGEVVDDDHFSVLDDVVDVALVDDLCLERRFHVAGEAVVLGRVDVVDAEQPLELLDAFLGEEHGGVGAVEQQALHGARMMRMLSWQKLRVAFEGCNFRAHENLSRTA